MPLGAFEGDDSSDDVSSGEDYYGEEDGEPKQMSDTGPGKPPTPQEILGLIVPKIKEEDIISGT